MTMASNGKHLINNEQIIKNPRWMIILHTVMDVCVFLAVSIGFIIQDYYYLIFGYPKKELNGEIALITGGGGGLGRLLALRLVKNGTTVVLWDICQEGIDETIKMIQSIGGKCKGYIVDISNKDDVYKAADAIRRDIGDITLLINNAGVVSGRPLLDTPDHMIERSFNVNILAHFWTTKAFLPAMIEKDHGHIVTIASLAGHVGIAKLVDYCSSKFAAVGFDEGLRLELESIGADNVHTTVICPYFIQSTGMFEDVKSRWVPTLNSEDVADRIIEAIKTNEKCAIIPGYLKIMLSVKWIFPWGCVGGFLKRLVPDAAPQHSIQNGTTKMVPQNEEEMQSLANNNTKCQNGTPLLIHRVSVGERVL